MHFQRQLNSVVGEAGAEPDVEKHWARIKAAVSNTAERVLGFESHTRRQPWIDQECLDALEDRRKTREKVLQRDTRSNRQKFREERKKAKKVCRRKKREKDAMTGMKCAECTKG